MSMDDSVAFGEEAKPQRFLKHPIAVVFHLAFRIGALLTYLFSEWFTASFIIGFLFILLFLSLDFWTVKNVTGRLLAGLRWWNFVDDEGQSHWRYEARKDESKTNVHEYRIFWLALILCPLLWAVFAFVTLVTLKWRWLIVDCLGLSMSAANAYGYLRCRWNSRQEMSSYLSQTFLKSFLTRAASATTAQPSQRQNAAGNDGFV